MEATLELDPKELMQLVASKIALRHDPEALWDSSDVADYLRCERRQVTDRFGSLPGFPQATRPPNGKGRGHPRWKAKDVRAWAEKYFSKAP